MSNLRILKHISGIVLFSIILFVAMHMQQLWGPTQKRGFYCYDTSIRKPILQDTIGSTSLYILGVAIPLGIICVCELWIHCSGSIRVTLILMHLYLNLMPFYYGFAIERFVKNIGKLTVARLRPYFYDACQPLMANGMTCDEDEILAPRILIGPYECSANPVSETIFQSFPSGHSSLAFYGMVFIILYLQKLSGKCIKNYTSFGLLLPLLQVLCILVALSVAVTRVLDYKHFLSDVVVGAFLGATVAVVVSIYRNKYVEDIANDDVEDENPNNESHLSDPKVKQLEAAESPKICCSIEMEGL